jgi:hypothetical protein
MRRGRALVCYLYARMDRLLCTKDVARRLNLERKTVAGLLNAGKIPAARLNDRARAVRARSVA